MGFLLSREQQEKERVESNISVHFHFSFYVDREPTQFSNEIPATGVPKPLQRAFCLYTEASFLHQQLSTWGKREETDTAVALLSNAAQDWVVNLLPLACRVQFRPPAPSPTI